MEKDQNVNIENQNKEEKIPETEHNFEKQKEEVKEITSEEKIKEEDLKKKK